MGTADGDGAAMESTEGKIAGERRELENAESWNHRREDEAAATIEKEADEGIGSRDQSTGSDTKIDVKRMRKERSSLEGG